MSRYIEVSDAVNALCKGCGWHENQCDTDKGFWCESRGLIEDAPHIDIVRCKECKYAHMTYGGECKYCDKWSLGESLYLDGDFFCSYGERKEGE